MYKVSQSKMRAWRQCRRLYHYKYYQNIEPRRPKAPLVRGRIIHEMIEAMIDGNNPWKVLAEYEKQYKKLFAEQREMYGDLIGEIKRTMTWYFVWWNADPIKYLQHPATKKRSEHEFEVAIGDVLFTGKVDSLGTTKDKRTWLVEHKSMKTFPTDEFRYTDLQSALYTRFLERTWKGLNIDGVAWNYIRTKPPQVPELLKSGELSHRDIDTIWPVYEQAIKDHKLDLADYADMRKKLNGKEESFFKRVYLPVNRSIVDNLYNETVATAHEMAELHDEPQMHVRNMTPMCSKQCEYYNLCQAELRGLDADWIRKKDFQQREKKDEVQEEAEDDQR